MAPATLTLANRLALTGNSPEVSHDSQAAFFFKENFRSIRWSTEYFPPPEKRNHPLITIKKQKK
jgi:hypothetical protein